jgi:hypothetical protein
MLHSGGFQVGSSLMFLLRPGTHFKVENLKGATGASRRLALVANIYILEGFSWYKHSSSFVNYGRKFFIKLDTELMVLGSSGWGLYHKTYYGCNLGIYVIS